MRPVFTYSTLILKCRKPTSLTISIEFEAVLIARKEPARDQDHEILGKIELLISKLRCSSVDNLWPCCFELPTLSDSVGTGNLNLIGR